MNKLQVGDMVEAINGHATGKLFGLVVKGCVSQDEIAIQWVAVRWYERVNRPACIEKINRVENLTSHELLCCFKKNELKVLA